ncbi:hypothetical protein BGW38_010170 [Lunasporangiospora selenospora]|uniref:J domain-containing protein n=1 Tax=Lunasporangiospora selenospora TaxID=979761 RepID=A0A9P6KIY7_9FUNG|nr:hypothetical protein BGW38_010170 [Lunasporangiospora selenospora]
MRWNFNLALLMLLALLALVQCVAAWEEGDFEIFDLVDALEKDQGSDVSFYSWIGVAKDTPKADIERAFRKKSRTLHPDKNKAKGAQERYARLSSIIAILRDDRKRERYDFFLKNGVPRWRGSAYLYSRHRPGLKAVTVFLLFIASGFQYLGRYVGYMQERRRMSRMIEQYKEMTREKYQKTLDGPLTGRQRRAGQTSETATPPPEASPMYAVNQYGEEIELTLDNIHSPKVKDLVIFRIPFWIAKLALKGCPKSVQEKVLALDIFESIRPDDEMAEMEARRARRAELTKKRAAKKAQQKGTPSASDDEVRRRRMKAPGQASLKGGRRG